MAESTAACAICGNVYSIRVMRFNKCKLSGEWEYQCSECRRQIKDEGLKH